MSVAEIEAELPRLSAEELRQIAVRSWSAFVERETADPTLNVCDEDDPRLLDQLDDAIRQADHPGQQDYSADDVRTRIHQWTNYKIFYRIQRDIKRVEIVRCWDGRRGTEPFVG